MTIGVMGITTQWQKQDGELKHWGYSAAGGADVTFDGSVLTGNNTQTGDSVWVSTTGTAINFFCKTKGAFGSFGYRDVTLRGLISAAPEFNNNNVIFSAKGGAVSSALSSMEIDPPTGYTYLGYTPESSADLSVIFSY